MAMEPTTSNPVKKPMFDYKSKAMIEILSEVNDYAIHGFPCILLGSTGVGKEFVARKYYDVFIGKRKSNGPFVSYNCAGLTVDLAISELFGHVKGAFTGANNDRNGLFKEAANGILFLDEIGELRREVQAMLLRAIDPGIQEAKPLGSDNVYSTSNVLVIAATDKPENIQDQLMNRLGAMLVIPGLDDRKEDVPPAIRFYLQRALAKRIDKVELINNIFGQKYATDNYIDEVFFELKEPTIISDKAAEKMIPLVWNRSWPGNLRSLRIAVDTAVIRAKNTKNPDTFVEDIIQYFKINLERFSKPLQTNVLSSIAVQKNEPALIDKTFTEIYLKIKAALPRITEVEKHEIAKFLASQTGITFTRADFESVLNSKTRTAQNRLGQLVSSGILYVEGKRKDCYKLATINTENNLVSRPGFFLSLPPDVSEPTGREQDVEELTEIVPRVNALFLSGEKGSGKTVVALALANKLSGSMNTFYYPVGVKGFVHFIRIIGDEIKNRGIVPGIDISYNTEDSLLLTIASLAGFIDKLFPTDKKPLLIIDNLYLKGNNEMFKVISTMLKYWKGITFILIGNKLDNSFHFSDKDMVIEYNLK
jgi:transcriptional regulator with AAA-type ATPase domain